VGIDIRNLGSLDNSRFPGLFFCATKTTGCACGSKKLKAISGKIKPPLVK
jgi:hypothetical protein